MAEKEYIERELAEKTIDRFEGYLDDDMIFRIKYAIRKHIPAADVAPVRHGRWVKEKRDVLIHWHCSACRECYFLDVPNAKYCPHCGCKMNMDGGEGE